MNSLKFEYNWQPGLDRSSPEFCATFAELEIRVDDRVITSVFAKNARTVLSHVNIALYPLAEWIVANWWPLLEEVRAPGRKDYDERHNLRRGREGFSIPDLFVRPEGPYTCLEWHPRRTHYESVDYLEQGSAYVRTETVRQAFSDFIEGVVGRLTAEGVDKTWLQAEWETVRHSEADPDEREFCRTAGSLGLDPYEVSEEQAAEIECAWHRLPDCVREDVFRVALPGQLAQAADWVLLGLKSPTTPPVAFSDRWQQFRRNVSGMKMEDIPWKRGYQLAEECRKWFDLQGRIPVPLGEVLGFDPLPLIHEAKPNPGGFDGIVATNGGLAWYTAKKRPDSQKFLVARGIADLLSGNHPAYLLSAARTERQQHNRAFAAELLAPADFIRSRLSGDAVDSEQMQDIADELVVSTDVVKHQIQNHRLAEVAEVL